MPALAQADAGYSPPPMFEDMTPPMVRPEKPTGNLVEKKVSPPPVVEKVQEKPVVVAPRVSVNPDAPKIRPIPIPPKKPAAVPATPQASVPSAPGFEKPKYESAIKGPKTMPALPAEKVDTQVLYNGDEDKGAQQTIFERQQKIAAEERKTATQAVAPVSANKASDKTVEPIDPVVPRPKDASAAVRFETETQQALKKIIHYEPGQIRLVEDLTNSIAAGVVQELDAEDKKDWRVHIKSYATPHGDGISSDKRIALSRALSLRSSLIEQGVAANRMDVLSEGIPADGTKGKDRIDLYLYETKAP